jgi:hypothetical protein
MRVSRRRMARKLLRWMATRLMRRMAKKKRHKVDHQQKLYHEPWEEISASFGCRAG